MIIVDSFSWTGREPPPPLGTSAPDPCNIRALALFALMLMPIAFLFPRAFK